MSGDGPASRQTMHLAVVIFVIAGVVTVIVVTLLVVAAARRRAAVAEGPVLDPPSSALPIWAGAVAPTIVLAGVLFLSFGALRDQNRNSFSETVQVIGHQWWWEVRYQGGATSANELRIPAGQRVRVELTSADVIHSFWVPSLAGKRDAIPGRWSTLYLEADQPGQWNGPCAEYCGLQHSNMTVEVTAMQPAEYSSWISDLRAPAATPTNETILRGQQVFLGASCSYCHTVRGTDARATVGPDLTHFGSRPTIAAGALPNTTGALGGWILDPQRVKPGTKMPPTNLSGGDLQDLLAYLESLR
jgi:cytochrome c oxidase subunit 2